MADSRLVTAIPMCSMCVISIINEFCAKVMDFLHRFMNNGILFCKVDQGLT